MDVPTSPDTQPQHSGEIGRARPAELAATCRRCGYDLRGLTGSDRCPECGSARAPDAALRYADPHWVAGLASGARWLFWGIVIAILALFAALSAFFIPSTGVARRAIALAASLLRCYGVWKLSAPDPGGVRGSGGRWPLVVRISVLIGLWGSFVGSLVIAHAAGNISAKLNVLAVVAGLIEHVAILAFLGQLCRRIPNLALARRARWIMWGVIAAYGAILIASTIGLIAIFGGWGRPGAVMTAVPAVIGLLMAAIFGLLYLLLVGDLAGVLHEEARRSRQPVARADGRHLSVGSSSEAAPPSRAEQPRAD